MASPKDALYDPTGIKMRRQVLGDAHVDRALNNATDFDQEFHQYITKYAWGEVWARPELPPRIRSLITIALLAALGREEELRLHLRASANTGATAGDVKQALFHVAIYAGVPAANTAFRIAKEIFTELAAKESKP
ncbi:MAG TPA: 4-carboxymuconolactone decarboxylase [Candidatus Binataceae bacterium]|nr:4-carboxymuconolactone decarboxylase [Candidatus Binataceae bacterium]